MTPLIPRAALSAGERTRIIERIFATLYSWYVAKSQKARNWNPDLSFEWKCFSKSHSPDVIKIIEGFFAVEQYVPDYTSRIVEIVRRSYGRSHFQLRWGAEEERHANAWENALLFSGARSSAWIEDYKHALRQREWTLPWDDPLHMLVYTVFQERATQLNYLNLALRAAPGEQECDQVLYHVCSTIATDEAAHYAFFQEGLRLHLYYFPFETLEAILDVLKHFAMPAQDIIPDWGLISEAIYRQSIYGPKEFSRGVVAVIFANLGLESRRSVEDGLRRSRQVPAMNGMFRGTSIWDAFDADALAKSIRALVQRLNKWNRVIGKPEMLHVDSPIPSRP